MKKIIIISVLALIATASFASHKVATKTNKNQNCPYASEVTFVATNSVHGKLYGKANGYHFASRASATPFKERTTKLTDIKLLSNKDCSYSYKNMNSKSTIAVLNVAKK